jgi:large subunit ribosomal protein L6
MSKIGLDPVKIADGVQVEVADKMVTVKGPKGELKVELPWKVSAEVKDGQVLVTISEEDKIGKSLHGTFRMLIANAVEGVKNGYTKNLELVGVGYRARMEGTSLVLNLGLNHPVKFDSPEGITVEVPEETKIIVSGIDKQKVGEHAARIREVRKPEPYKGKGIRYEGEYVRRKSAKAAVAEK